MKLRSLLVLMVSVFLVVGFGVMDARASDGEVKMKISAVGLGVGHTKGEGTLTFKGKEYPFTVEGISLGTVGISSVKYKGYVYNLKKVSDFPGKYFGGQIGLATGGGDSGFRVTNDKDVVMTLVGSEEGMSASLGSKGLTIKMK